MPKEEYPIPQSGQIVAGRFPNPSRAGVLPLDENNPHPHACFMGSVDDWDIALFRHAEYFTVFRLGAFIAPAIRKRERTVFERFPDATKNAQNDPRAILYAVTQEGRSIPLSRAKWGMYRQIWETDHVHNTR